MTLPKSVTYCLNCHKYLVDFASSTAYGPLTVTVVKPGNKMLDHFEGKSIMTSQLAVRDILNLRIFFFFRKKVIFLKFRLFSLF